MDLEAKQREMKARMAKQQKTRVQCKPLPRGVYVAPVRRGKPVVDFPELQRLLTARLRSPKTKADDWQKLFEIGVRYGLVSPNIRPVASAETESGLDVRVGEDQVDLKEVLRLEREKRARVIKERETNKQ